MGSFINHHILYLQPLCGLPLSPYFSALKLRWLLDNVPRVKAALAEDRLLFGTVDSWLVWNLTGGKVHITDATNASRTMLMNIETLSWDPMLLQFFDVPLSILPEIRPSADVYGTISDGPMKGIRIAGCLGDQQAALVGQQCLNKGNAKATYGTGCFLLYNTGPVNVDSANGLLTTVAYQLSANHAPVYAIEGSLAIAGAALGWLRDNLELIQSARESEEIALTVETNGDVYFVPAFSGLYAPYWAQDARGVMCGITENTNRGHVVRASLEAVCFQVRDILDAMSKDCGIPLQSLRVDGGMTENKLLMQTQADLIGMKIIKPKMAETTALGAAMVAGFAVGAWDLERVEVAMETELIKPQIDENERDMRYSKWKMAIERSMGWDTN